MSCTALQTELSQLKNRRKEQASIVESLPHNAGWEAAKEVLAGIDADITRTQAEFDECLAEQPKAQNILGKLDRIECHAAQRELGHDEPYLLIATFDMHNVVNLGIVGVNLPAVNVVKIGPWQGVDRYETHKLDGLPKASRQPFWDLDGKARTIAHPQDVIFLVAFMENDSGSPDVIRGAVRDNLLASRTTNANRAYSAYVTTMISNFRAAIDVTRGIAFADDVIGNVTQLSLTTAELALLNSTIPDPVERPLRFKTTKANGKVVNDYTAYFSFTV